MYGQVSGSGGGKEGARRPILDGLPRFLPGVGEDHGERVLYLHDDTYMYLHTHVRTYIHTLLTYIILHYTTLHYIALNYITLHTYITYMHTLHHMNLNTHTCTHTPTHTLGPCCRLARTVLQYYRKLPKIGFRKIEKSLEQSSNSRANYHNMACGHHLRAHARRIPRLDWIRLGC